MNFKKIGSRGGKTTAGDAINLEITFKNSALNISARILCKDSKDNDVLNDSLKLVCDIALLDMWLIFHLKYLLYLSLFCLMAFLRSHESQLKQMKESLDAYMNSLHWTTFNQEVTKHYFSSFKGITLRHVQISQRTDHLNMSFTNFPPFPLSLPSLRGCHSKKIFVTKSYINPCLERN